MTGVRSLGSCTALEVRRGLNAVLYVARSRSDLNGLTSNPTVSVRIALSNLSLVSRRMAPVSAALSHTSPVRGDQTGTLTSAKAARLSDEPFILDPMKDGLSVSRRTVCFWLSGPTRQITLLSGGGKTGRT